MTALQQPDRSYALRGLLLRRFVGQQVSDGPHRIRDASAHRRGHARGGVDVRQKL